jgi:SAM-dependent methyltransferase
MLPETLQAQYYTQSAAQYDVMHTSDEKDEHYAALEIIDSLAPALQLRTFLDVGCGTGRAVGFLHGRGKDVRGVEPVAELLREAAGKALPAGALVQGNGYALPFGARSFDAVIECGVLHHVAEPARVIEEMMRVAKKAIFLSDCNRFGQGSMAARFCKFGLYKLGLWSVARKIQTRGKGYTISAGDGLAYSYSVYDSYDRLARWSKSIWILQSGGGTGGSWFSPLFTAPHVLLVAVRDSDGIHDL